MQSIGDLASYLVAGRQQTMLLRKAENAAQSTTTGVASNKAKHLGGSTLALSLMDRKEALLGSHQNALSEAAIFTSGTQAVLGRVQPMISDVANTLALTSQMTSSTNLSAISRSAESAFVDTVAALNTEIAGRHLFSGTATDRAPLAPGKVMLDDLRTSLAGLTTAADVETAIDAWFNAAGGGFEASAYQGSATGSVNATVSDAPEIIGLRADDQAIRDTLKGLALAVFASDPMLGLPQDTQKTVFANARTRLTEANESLIGARSRVGAVEARIEAARSEADRQLDQINSAKRDLIGTDQFEQITEFEASQQQLETFYRIAARQSRTSLAEYLR